MIARLVMIAPMDRMSRCIQEIWVMKCAWVRDETACPLEKAPTAHPPAKASRLPNIMTHRLWKKKRADPVIAAMASPLNGANMGARTTPKTITAGLSR